MIKNFHVLYVGQIELDNIGLNGTPANDRRYSDERLREAFATARDVAQLMDRLGYDVLWTAEHHFQREGYEVLPNLIQLGLWLATQTERLKFGCAFNVLPMWHPIRLAEDYAMADIVTDGRVIMGVGRGYHTREVETFGAPLLDAEANRELFEEQLQLLLKCFNEDAFHHKGKYYECPPPVDYRGYRLEEITMVPRPKHLPVEIWMPIASGKTIDMMARYGLKAMVTLNGQKILDDVVRAFHEACQRHGRKNQLGEDMIWGAGVYLADSEEEAIRKLEPAHDERFKWFAPFGFVRYADEHGRTWGTPGRARRRALAARRGQAEGLVLRPAEAGDRRHQVDRRQISRAGEFHDPLGRRAAAQGVQGAAHLVRQGRDAGVQDERAECARRGGARVRWRACSSTRRPTRVARSTRLPDAASRFPDFAVAQSGLRGAARPRFPYSLVKQPTLRGPGPLFFGRPGAPFPLFPAPSRHEGHGAPGGAGCLGEHPADLARSAARRSLRRAHPNDVGVRRLPALHLRRLRRGHVLPRRPAPLPASLRSQGRTRGETELVHDMFSSSLSSSAL